MGRFIDGRRSDILRINQKPVMVEGGCKRKPLVSSDRNRGNKIMAIQLNFYNNADVSIIDLMNTADATFIGRHQVSLTNYDNTSLPAIAIGSIVENNGALFKFAVETAISGTAVDGTNYILLVPSGDPSLGTANVTPTWSQTAPAWSDSKQGWYGTGGSANYRYLEFVMTKATAVYSNKRPFSTRDDIDNTTYMVGATINNRSYVKAYLNSAQTITGAINTKINLDTETYDTNSEFSSSRFTAKKSGYFLINVNIQENIASNAASQSGRIWVNGNPYASIGELASTPKTGNVKRQGSAVVYLAVGGYVEIYKNQSSGDSTSITNGADLTFIEVIEL